MKKVKLFLSLIAFMFVSINNVYAQCSDKDLQKYKDMINNINISYEYNENPQIENTFTITIFNIPKEIKIYENKLSYIFKNDSNEEFITLTESNFLGGTNTNFMFYTTSYTNCPDLKLKQENIKLPVYNKFWNDPLCKGIEKFNYCNKIIDKEITYEGFKKNVLKYKESLNEIIETTEEKNSVEDILKQITNYINENKILVIISFLSFVVLLIIICSIIIRRKRRKVL